RHVQLVAQTQIKCPSRRNLPVILDKEVVIGRAQAAFAAAVAETRPRPGAGQKILEPLEIDPASAVLIICEVVLVVDDLGARADAVLASRDREAISNRRRRHGDPPVWQRRGTKTHPTGVRRNANQRKTRKGIGVGPADSDIGVFHLDVWENEIANEVVAYARLVDGFRAESVYVLKRDEPVVLLPIITEAWNISASFGKSDSRWRVREEELDREPVTLVEVMVNVRVELIFLVTRGGGAGVSPVRLGSRDQKLPIRQLHVQEGERRRMD